MVLCRASQAEFSLYSFLVCHGEFSRNFSGVSIEFSLCFVGHVTVNFLEILLGVSRQIIPYIVGRFTMMYPVIVSDVSL